VASILKDQDDIQQDLPSEIKEDDDEAGLEQDHSGRTTTQIQEGKGKMKSKRKRGEERKEEHDHFKSKRKGKKRKGEEEQEQEQEQEQEVLENDWGIEVATGQSNQSSSQLVKEEVSTTTPESEIESILFSDSGTLAEK